MRSEILDKLRDERFPTTQSLEPDMLGGWGFYYPYALVKFAYTLWEASDFRQLPDPQTVAKTDPRWVADLQLYQKLIAHKRYLQKQSRESG